MILNSRFDALRSEHNLLELFLYKLTGPFLVFQVAVFVNSEVI